MSIATFGDKVFEVSRKKIYTPDSLTHGKSLTTETQEIEGKKPATYIKGKGLMSLSFNLRLDARYVSVETEIDYWYQICENGIPKIFTIGGKPLSPHKFLLKSASLTDCIIGKKGEYLLAKLGLSFEEFVSAGYKQQTTTTTTSKAKTSTKSKGSLTANEIKTIEAAIKK